MWLSEIASDGLAIDPKQIAPVAIRADQSANVVAGFNETAEHGRADKTCGASHKSSHRLSSFSLFDALDFSILFNL
jgi:hypothetical protein